METQHREDPIGHVAAWLVLGFVNVASAAVNAPQTGLAPRLALHAHDLAFSLIIGSLLSATVALWQLWGPRQPPWGWLFAALAAVGFSQLELPADLQSGVGSIAPEGYDGVLARLVAAIAGLGMPVAAYVAARVAATRARYVVTAVGLGLAFGHQLVLPNLYPAIHVFCTVTAAVWLAPSLAPGARRAVGAIPARAVQVGFTVALLVAVWLAVTPSSRVISGMLQVPGAVWPPVAAQWVSFTARASATPGSQADSWEPWLRSRVDAPPTPPTRARVLPDDAIVLFIIVDAMRADVLHPPAGAEFPVMRRLRDEGVSFTHAWAPAPATMESRASILTGRYALQLEWRRRPRSRDRRLRPDFSSAPQLTDVLEEKQGFEHTTFNQYRLKVRGAGPVARATVKWLRKVEPGVGWFVYVHFYEGHEPYRAGGKRGPPKDRYLRALEAVDSAIGTIVTAVEESGLSSRVMVVLTADHGEAFGEHNSKYHGSTTYDEVTRVPFIFYGPWFQPRVVDARVSLIDFFPTVLDLLGQATPGPAMGQSLVPFLMGGETQLARPIFIDSQGKDRALLFPDDIKLIRRARGGLFEVYDLNHDPDEIENLAETLEDTADRRAVFERFVDAHQR